MRGVTILEIERWLGAALAAPPSADSAAKAKFKFAESRRKKNEEKRKNFKELFNSNGATGGLSKNCVLLSDCAIKKRNSFMLSPITIYKIFLSKTIVGYAKNL